MESDDSAQRRVKGRSLVGFVRMRNIDIERDYSEISSNERHFVRFFEADNMNVRRMAFEIFINFIIF